MNRISMSAMAIAVAITGLFTAALASQASRAAIELQTERLGAHCDAGMVDACKRLVLVTGGQCAGPEWSGCRYGSQVKPD